MDYLDLTLPTPEANLALEEALLLEAEAGQSGEVLRCWELPRYAVVLGSAGQLEREVQEEACRIDSLPILRRCSGGGTVLLGPGCVCYSLVLSLERPPLQDITHSYQFIMARLSQALSLPSATVACAGSSDLVVADRKISGNSQRRLRSFILHHGTVLYAVPASLLGRYLLLPARQPGYRENRAHDEFLTNLPMHAEEIKRRLRRAWRAESLRVEWPREAVDRLVAEKYSRDEWIQRR